MFHYEREKLEKKGIRAIWLQYFLKEWSQHGNAEFSKRYGIKWRPLDFDRTSIGTYLPYMALDTDLFQVNQMIKYIKFGFGQCLEKLGLNHYCHTLLQGI